MAEGGNIVIGTRLVTDKFDRQVADLERKIKKEEDRKILIEAKLNTQQQDFDKARKDVDELAEAYQRFKEIQDVINTGTATASQFSLIQDLQNTYGSLDALDLKFDRALNKQDAMEQKVNQTKMRYDELNTKVAEYKQKIENIKIQQQVSEVDKLKQSFSNLSSPIQNAVKQVARLALGIFGIRSAYMLVRRASSDLANYDQQYATNLEYIRYALANAIAPVLRWIVSATATILHYIGIILNALFGINIFSNSSAKAFTNMKKGASGVSKAVGEIKKQLAGFDEMNVLQDNGSTSAGGGGGGIGGVATPDFDFSDLDIETPAWLQWIVDNRELVLGFLKALAIAVATIKIIKWLQGISQGLSFIVKGLKALGSNMGTFLTTHASLLLIAAGIATLVTSIGYLIFNWDNLNTKQKILIGVLGALGAAVIALGVSIALGISTATLGIGALIAGIIALVTAIVAFIAKCVTEEKAIKSVKDATKSLKEAQEELKKANEDYVNAVDKAEDALNDLKEAEKRTGISGEELFKKVQNGTLDYANMTKEQKEVYKAYLNNEKEQEALKKATELLNQAKHNEKMASWESKLATDAESGSYDKFKNSVIDAFNKGELSAEEARTLIEKSMTGMSRASQQTFMKDLPTDIRNGLDPKRYETTGQKLGKWFQEKWENFKRDAKAGINNVGNTITTGLNSFIGKINTKFSEIGQKVGQTLADPIKKAMNTVLAKVEEKLNSVVNKINKFIDIINSVPRCQYW